MLPTAVVVFCATPVLGTNHGYKSSREWLPRVAPIDMLAPPPPVAVESLPEAFDWRDVDGRNFIVDDWNQHIPQYCGACWIHGTVNALNDRLKVRRGGRWPDVKLSRQAIMNCVPSPTGGDPPGCNGGDAFMIHSYLYDTKVPDESCMPYTAQNMGCQPDTICRNCHPSGDCFAVPNFTSYGVSSFGNVTGEEEMMQEIFTGGPIACSFATDGDFMYHYAENVLQNDGVYVPSPDKNYTEDMIDHVMEVAGWGETTSGLKYWVIRNSWGTYWGDLGWLKLQRGTNALFGETYCDWAVPSFGDLDAALAGTVLGSYVQGTAAVAPNDTDPTIEDTLKSPSWPPVVARHGGVTVEGIEPTEASRISLDLIVLPSITFILGGALALLASKLSRKKGFRQSPLLG